jgi:hypothetical protein
MSADNGIYVLYTDSLEYGPEYRVVHAQAIANIYGQWNEETGRYDGDSVAIKDYFGTAPVFYTLDEAMDYAEQQENDIGYTEDGICLINEFKEHGNIFY